MDPSSKYFVLLVLKFLLGLTTFKTIQSSELKDYCQAEFFNVTCPRNGVIFMESAQYGRMRTGRCIAIQGVVGCSIDVLAFFDRRCSGTRHCEVYVANQALQKLEPCSKDYTTYLEAKYTCLNAATGSMPGCRKDGRVIISGQNLGYLASITTIDSGYGAAGCPWRLQAGLGQTIRLTLLSFGARRTGDDHDTGSVAAPEVCYEIGEIKDGLTRTTMSMCGGSNRENAMYVSAGNDVIVQLLSAEVLRGLSPFIIKFEVQGCLRLADPVGGWIQIEGNKATLRCNVSKETFFLTCNGNRWEGQLGNCTEKAMSRSEGVMSSLEDNFPYGILVVVAIGVALGVLIGGILLSVVAYYMKRQNHLHRYSDPAELSKQMVDEDGYNDATQTRMTTPGTHYIHHHERVLTATGHCRTPLAYSDEPCGCPALDDSYSTRTHEIRCLPQQTDVAGLYGGGRKLTNAHLYECPTFT